MSNQSVHVPILDIYVLDGWKLVSLETGRSKKEILWPTQGMLWHSWEKAHVELNRRAQSLIKGGEKC